MMFATLLAISLAAPPAAHATHFPAPVANPVALCRAPAPTVSRTLALPGRATSCCTGAAGRTTSRAVPACSPRPGSRTRLRHVRT